MLERIITALVLVSVVLSCMFATSAIYPMFGLMVLAALGAGYEWFKLMPRKNGQQTPNLTGAWVVGVVVSAITAFAILFLQDVWILFWITSILIWLVSFVWVRRYPSYDGWYRSNLLYLGVVLIVAAVTAIFSLWSISPWWLMYVFLLVWGADSGAYFVGRKFGMRKLAPNVSPNKSVEGMIGGLVTSAVLIIIVATMYLDVIPTAFILFVLLSLLTVLSSVLGDLVESMVKRRAGIKDSGRILPGHGGVLDRVDSLLAAAPVFATGLYLLKVLGFNF